MRKKPTEAYLEKAKHLTQEQVEYLLSRVRAKLMRRLEDQTLDTLEVVAIQLQLDDERLNEWRERMTEITNSKHGGLDGRQGSSSS